MDILDMQLESVRTVLKNEVNEITVCINMKQHTGSFYTVISITSGEVRRKIAAMLAGQNLFGANSDYLGSYTKGEALCLVFLYRQENLLSRREALYGDDFIKRKELAERFIVALAETQIAGSVGLLLLMENNLNMTLDGNVAFNYFLDFASWDQHFTDTDFYRRAAKMAFDILSRDYARRFANHVPSYPSELQVFYKKIERKSFTSINSILTFLRMIPNTPTQVSVGVRKVVDQGRGFVGFVRRHATLLFVILLVSLTVLYAAYQIVLRISYSNSRAKNITYVGLDTIGEIYLGDQTV